MLMRLSANSENTIGEWVPNCKHTLTNRWDLEGKSYFLFRQMEKFGIRTLRQTKPILSDLGTYLTKVVPNDPLQDGSMFLFFYTNFWPGNPWHKADNKEVCGCQVWISLILPQGIHRQYYDCHRHHCRHHRLRHWGLFIGERVGRRRLQLPGDAGTPLQGGDWQLWVQVSFCLQHQLNQKHNPQC